MSLPREQSEVNSLHDFGHWTRVGETWPLLYKSDDIPATKPSPLTSTKHTHFINTQPSEPTANQNRTHLKHSKMPKAEDNYKLLFSIINQIASNRRLTGIDWSKVAADLDLSTPHAANLRWSRFKRAHGLGSATNSSQGVSKVVKSSGGKKGAKNKVLKVTGENVDEE